MTRYAVYVITIEDTEANDALVAGLPAESVERPAGNMDWDTADLTARQATDVARAFDEGIWDGSD